MVVLFLSFLMISWGQSVWEHTAQPQQVSFYWRDQDQKIFNSLDRFLKVMTAQKKEIVFAMNGGMFAEDFSPLGLYIEDGKQIRPIITRKKAYGNFYIQPNGVFAIDQSGKAHIFATDDFQKFSQLKYATQSGPLLVHKNRINKNFTKNSKNKEIRNGVGLLPSGDVLMVVSQGPINFYDFAQFFKSKGCTEALYLDGSISQVYFPRHKIQQVHGPIGVIIAVKR